jgi:hypothetical protein
MILIEIHQMFQSEKVADIFSHSEGSLGMVNIEIEKGLTFREISHVAWRQLTLLF